MINKKFWYRQNLVKNQIKRQRLMEESISSRKPWKFSVKQALLEGVYASTALYFLAYHQRWEVNYSTKSATKCASNPANRTEAKLKDMTASEGLKKPVGQQVLRNLVGKYDDWMHPRRALTSHSFFAVRDQSSIVAPKLRFTWAIRIS